MGNVLREALWTLRQRRYARLTALMVVIAAVCIVAGTWQIQRFEQSVRDNNALKRNAHAAASALTTSIVPLVGAAAAPGRDAVRYRTVTASGRYLTGHREFVRGASQNGAAGFLVLEPFRTQSGVLMVVRGFVAGSDRTGDPNPVTAPPTGESTIAGRLQTAGTEDDRAGALAHAEVRSVNPTQQAGRLGLPVYNAYLTLTAGQPGTSGVAVVPKPDLSNPAGGAYEAQHFAYIVQWYLFAVLALAAPFVMSRSETREAQRRFLGIEPGTRDFDRALAGSEERPQLESVAGAGAGAGAGAAAAVAVRPKAVVARVDGPSPQRWQRGNRLADRYGRSFGVRAAGLAPAELAPDAMARDAMAPDATVPDAPSAPRGGNAIAALEPVLGQDRPSSAGQPYRSPDPYHGSYNDYLWELALADGNIPTGNPIGDSAAGPNDADAINVDDSNPDDGGEATALRIATVRPDGRAVITSQDPPDPPRGNHPAGPGR